MQRFRENALIWSVIIILFGFSLWFFIQNRSNSEPTILPTPTFEPVVPTQTPVSQASQDPHAATQALSPTKTAVPTAIPTKSTENNASTTAVPLDLNRYNVTGSIKYANAAHALGLPFSAVLDWSVRPEPKTNGFDFWQMVRLDENGIRETTWDEIEETITLNPGSVWLIGNEPDVVWQDNVTPQKYAQHYHNLYTFIKERDPSAQIAIGGISQSTPLRRAYLDIVLDTYMADYGEPMPVDIWNIHAFTLREEADSWGIGIPPGMDVTMGELYEIEDHTDINILRQNLIDFRMWMAERGYADHPLVITEYGVLMPVDYGFPSEVVTEFMLQSFDLFENLRGEYGYAADENRLIQSWFWFILYVDQYEYQAGNLYDHENGQLTPVGEVWAAYLNGRSK